jgi:hypothetical protein
MNYSNSTLYELVDIEDIIIDDYDSTAYDIEVEDDASFLLSNGFISHNSASSAFRRFRDPQTQGAFPLRGKFINVREISDSKVAQNKEVQALMAAMGLKIGHKPFEYVKPSGTRIKFKLNDGTTIIGDLNDEILINNNWIQIKDFIKTLK